MNRQYLEAIRSNSCYPAFRGFVKIFTFLGYLLAIGIVVAGMVTGQIGYTILAFVGAIIYAILIRVAKEVSLMLADIADATIDSSSKSVFAASVESAVSVASQPTVATSPPEDDDVTAMTRYGITFTDEKYQFQDYRYDKLSDAITYAKRQLAQA